MAIRLRKTGRLLCAAAHKKLPDDCYIDDTLHHELYRHGYIRPIKDGEEWRCGCISRDVAEKLLNRLAIIAGHWEELARVAQGMSDRKLTLTAEIIRDDAKLISEALTLLREEMGK